MKPGREMDALVAEKVMGLTGVECRYSDSVDEWLVTYDHHTGAHLMKKIIPAYSTNIAAAWAVVEKFPHFYLYRWATYVAPNGKTGQWECRFSDLDDGRMCVWSDTAPHAICLAALKACGVEI